MSTEAFDQSYEKWNVSRWVTYPKGCNLPDFVDYDWNRAFAHHGTRYLPEHRAYPGKSHLYDAITPRELVVTVHAEMGKQYHTLLAPCPHNGIHGTAVERRYYSALLQEGFVTRDIDEWIQRKNWSGALRRKLVKNRVNLASSVAEYRESASMFVVVAKRLFEAYRDIRHGRFPKFKRWSVSDIPASILYYNFGVAPLVGDLFSVVEALRLKLTAPITVRTSASVRRDLAAENVQFGGNEFQLSGDIRQRATIYYDMDPEQYASEYFDFGNPIEWAWELIPFSFVLDWVLPVGDYLESLDNLNGLSNIRGVVTTKVYERAYGRWGQASVNEEAFRSYTRTYKRDVITSVPIPLPSWNPSPSYMKLLNAGSILTTMRLNAFPMLKFLR